MIEEIEDAVRDELFLDGGKAGRAFGMDVAGVVQAAARVGEIGGGHDGDRERTTEVCRGAIR